MEACQWPLRPCAICLGSAGKAVLFKRQSLVARSAQFGGEGQLAADAEFEAEPPSEANVEHQPTEQDLEIARLKAEAAALQRDLDGLRSDLEASVREAEQRAFTLAMEQHVANEAAQIEACKAALSAARSAFDNALSSAILPAATSIAGEMLNRLVKPLLGESEWLDRSIAGRLEDLRANAIVKVTVPPSFWEGKPSAELNALMPAGTTIETDADLATSTARIVLRLGQIDIDPGSGLAMVLGSIGAADE